MRDEAAQTEFTPFHSSRQANPNSAVVRFTPQPGSRYHVRVRLAEGQAGRFHLAVLGAGLQHVTAADSVCFPADGSAVVAVGAVDGEGRRLGYSACGSTRRPGKPELVGVVPFVSSWRQQPFSGTSAAAPQAAGLATLWWSHYPGRTAEQVRGVLRASARDLGPRGCDPETGYGLIQLPRE
ncbi:hypothetical protein AYO44_15660 [Planctomycetaceae bacterium SCGC AG-212-F19]|nr:hypothetical protein AYO44_15660 [Planctomycetaceae bacterium SCGC AG-212-F19]